MALLQSIQYDHTLASDVGTILLSTVLRGYAMVSNDENVVAPFPKRLLITTPSDLIRHILYQLRIRISTWTFSEVYWQYGPYYFEDVDLADMQSITNGIDAYMVDRIISVGRHKTVTLKDIRSISMDYQNEDHP